MFDIFKVDNIEGTIIISFIIRVAGVWSKLMWVVVGYSGFHEGGNDDNSVLSTKRAGSHFNLK